MNLGKYQTLVFDCDGVILDSNKLKTDAFYKAALPYGEAAAEALVLYHRSNGGISRYTKFSVFLDRILPRFTAEVPRIKDSEYDEAIESLLTVYAKSVVEGLRKCNVAEGLNRLRYQTSYARWLVVSGGEQKELRQIFRERGIDDLFDGGIFGSPDTKDTILSRECLTHNVVHPALFLGDSYYDYKASQGAGLDFVFLSGWSEWQPNAEWLRHQGLPSVCFLKDLLDA